jgi:DNA-binding transcriptional LysR family regulator
LPLFHRHHRGVALTSAGRALLPYAMRIARLLEEARHAVVDDGRPRGLLTIGSLETTAALRLAPVLAAHAEAYPEVDLVLRTGTTCELIEDAATASPRVRSYRSSNTRGRRGRISRLRSSVIAFRDRAIT